MCVTQNSLALPELWPVAPGGGTSYFTGGSCEDKFRHKKPLKNQKQDTCICSGFGQCRRTFRPLIGILPRGELAVVADNTCQRFLVQLESG